MQTSCFTGPLFIVGMPRSGTKLLRELLNRHPGIAIPVIESQFIPDMIAQFGNPPDLGFDDEFDRFYQKFSGTKFFLKMKERGYILNKDELDRTMDRRSWSSILEAIFKFYAPPEKDKNFIWGDKTPSYLTHIDLLKSLYPQARFLHIIRDPRDYALSVNKTWGKSLYRAACLWRNGIEKARSSGHKLGQDYKELFYEALLENPEKILRDICQFLNCDFRLEMTRLKAPSENLGDTKGEIEIIRNNRRKYLTQLSPLTVKRIEEIVHPISAALGYEAEYGAKFRPLSPILSQMYRVYDKYMTMWFYFNKARVDSAEKRSISWVFGRYQTAYSSKD